MNDIIDWPIIKQLSEDFVANIKFVYIFYDGNAVICVTNDDKVYSYGVHVCGYEGYGNKNSKDKPKLIEELCHKRVCDIQLTSNSMVAITKSGHIYSWGQNIFGQLGNGTTIDSLKPVIINALKAKIVTDFQCGDDHCLALTQNGEVFEWGWSVDVKHKLVPINVNGLELLTISAISCGADHSLMLTNKGDVYSWGKNDCGECGTGCYDKILIPTKVNLNEKIIKIECGPNHSLLLTENEDIVSFGDNNYGQLGNGNKDNSNMPLKMSISTKFVEIATHSKYEYNISIGLSRDGFCYVWGECGEQTITEPTKSQFKSIDDALSYYSICKVTFKPYYFEHKFENLSILIRIENRFNLPELSDIQFKIEGKVIYVNSNYLRMVCNHFEAMFSDNVWLESNAKQVEITQYSYSVYYSFLKYLYTDSVDIEIEHIIDLYYLADSYFENALKRKCIEIMKNDMNINNVFNYWSFAVNNNLLELENYLFDFMKTRMNDVIESESYLQMNDISIHQKLLKSVLKNIG